MAGIRRKRRSAVPDSDRRRRLRRFGCGDRRSVEDQGLDVEYRRYPFDRTYADYFVKLADALSRVTTPFVVLADNDDCSFRKG